MTKIYLIDPQTKRHKANGKELLMETCEVISGLECKIAGYAVVGWDDRGRSAFCFRAGGPIDEGAIATHVSNKLRDAIRVVVDRVQ